MYFKTLEAHKTESIDFLRTEMTSDPSDYHREYSPYGSYSLFQFEGYDVISVLKRAQFCVPCWQFKYHAPLTEENNIFNCLHRVSIIQNARAIFKISDIRLLEALCDVNTDGKTDARQKYSKLLWIKNPVSPVSS